MPHTLAINKFNNCHKENTYESVSQISFQRTDSTPDIDLGLGIDSNSKNGFNSDSQDLEYIISIRSGLNLIGLVLVRVRAELDGSCRVHLLQPGGHEILVMSQHVIPEVGHISMILHFHWAFLANCFAFVKHVFLFVISQ